MPHTHTHLSFALDLFMCQLTLLLFAESEYGNNFIISHHQNAKFFTAADGHTTLSLKVADMEGELRATHFFPKDSFLVYIWCSCERKVHRDL